MNIMSAAYGRRSDLKTYPPSSARLFAIPEVLLHAHATIASVAVAGSASSLPALIFRKGL